MAGQNQDKRAILDGFFEAALYPGLWDQRLEALSDYVGGSAVNLVVLDKLGERPIAEQFVRGNDDAYAEYLADYFTIDRRVPRVAAAAVNSVLLEDHVLSIEERRTDIVYNEILSGNGMRNLALVNLSADGQSMGLGIAPRNDAAPFESRQVALLTDILPELRHALRFFNANRDLNIQRNSLGHLWDHAGKGIAILDTSQRVLFCNAVLEDHMRAGLLAIRHGMVSFADPQAEMLRREKTTRLLRDQKGRFAEFLAQNPTTLEQFSVRLVATPVIAGHFTTLRAPRFIMLVQSLSGDLVIGQIEIERFCQLFGVTPAEGRVVGAVAGGAALEAYAAQTGIATDTARKQLKSAMAKCGVSGQKALISRLERFCFLLAR